MTANESIVNYLEGDTDSIRGYFDECFENGKQPNYSEFCRKYLNGTTREGYDFSSSKVKRSELTCYLRSKYVCWLELVKIT